MKWIGQNIYDQISKFRNTVDFSGDVTFYQPVNDASPFFRFGSSENEAFFIRPYYYGGTQTLQLAFIGTQTESGVANFGALRFQVDGINILDIDDGGINFVANKGISINGTDVLTDSSGTATLSNIDVLDATTEATIEAAIDTLANLTSVGTITTGVWNGSRVASAYLDPDTARLTTDQTFTGTKTFNETIVGSISGSAATAATAIHVTITDNESTDENNLIPFLEDASENGNAIGLESDGDLTYNPSTGKVTATGFVGALTGQADTVATIAGLAPNTATTQASQPNITGVGTITTGTWQGTAIATDQQKHLATFDIRGYSTADGTNYEIPVFVTDNNAPFEHNTTAESDGLTALTVTKLIKATGVVMPYAGTLKKWKGWATHSTTSGTCNIALFRYRPNASSASNVSLVLLDAVTNTPAANNTVIAIDETTFTDADVAAGDVIISGIKGDGSQITYFVSTLEIEWD